MTNNITYSKTSLLNILKDVRFDLEITSVQDLANDIENKIITVADKVAPITRFINDRMEDSPIHPEWLTRKLNQRKKLLKKVKQEKTPEIRNRLKNLSLEIKYHFRNETKSKVRRGIKPGNNKTLWDAVKTAKDINTDELPDQMNINGKQIPNQDLADEFAQMFENKINNLVSEISIDQNVYNGSRKINEQDKNFMTRENIRNAISTLKLKNSEGFDRIPQRILIDGMQLLIEPFTVLFNQIYSSNIIPEQWSMSKITPIFKKGDRTNITNYRPISNLCSMSKVFEKLIMQRIHEIEDSNNVDLTGAKQHGFKRKRSTSTAGLEIQSEIARALDSNKYTLMASLDLSSAFDMVILNLTQLSSFHPLNTCVERRLHMIENGPSTPSATIVAFSPQTCRCSIFAIRYLMHVYYVCLSNRLNNLIASIKLIAQRKFGSGFTGLKADLPAENADPS